MTNSGQPLEVGRTFTLQPDDQLHIDSTLMGMRAYLCVAGGFDAPAILCSRSAMQQLSSGEVLQCQPGVIKGRRLAVDYPEAGAAHLDFRERERYRSLELRVLPGPQADWFPQGGQFFSTTSPSFFQVGQASNRMGLRLLGPPLPLPPRETVSEAVCPGTVQVTRDGQCIVLGVDGQTIGGYPKIAQVIGADLDRLGQLRPGEEVYFFRVSLEEAESLYREQQQRLRISCLRLREAAGL